MFFAISKAPDQEQQNYYEMLFIFFHWISVSTVTLMMDEVKNASLVNVNSCWIT